MTIMTPKSNINLQFLNRDCNLYMIHDDYAILHIRKRGRLKIYLNRGSLSNFDTLFESRANSTILSSSIKSY
jgi:hypothetical protein